MADTRKFQYRCSNGHEIYSAQGPLTKCLAISKGSPCKGTLTPFGPGSKAAKEKK
jgi:hypothetical protein